MVIKPSDEYFIDITTNNTSVFCFDFMNKLFKVGRLQDAKRTINARILDKEEAAPHGLSTVFPMCSVLTQSRKQVVIATIINYLELPT